MRVIRYFFDFVEGQERWLNEMAAKGYRLTGCSIFCYEFEKCNPNEYEYAVEFVADKSSSETKDYKDFLENLGFRTFTKNINLNYSIGKFRWRPWAKGLGQVATSPGNYNKELLIVEKTKNGPPIQLHTDIRDVISQYCLIRNSYAFSMAMCFAFVVISFFPHTSFSDFSLWGKIAFTTLGTLCSIPSIKYSISIKRLKEESRTTE